LTEYERKYYVEMYSMNIKGQRAVWTVLEVSREEFHQLIDYLKDLNRRRAAVPSRKPSS